MKNTPTTEARYLLLLATLWVGAWASGCGPEGSELEPLELGSEAQLLASINGLSANGLSANGLSANGLSANGLSANGLSTSAFSGWFAQDPAQADMLMTYVVRCAVPAGQSRSYTDRRTRQTYTWAGGLGLAVDWANGNTANYSEQQLVTACLLGHVNRYGVHVNISVLGWTAWGGAIAYTDNELALYKVREACFFGNLFTPNSLFFGVDRPVNNEGEYLTRACGEMGSGSSTQCAPLRFVGQCSQYCSGTSQGPFYSSCTFNGVSYKPITTRMKKADYDELVEDSGS